MTKSEHSIFTAEYWTAAAAEIRNFKTLVFSALIIALATVLNLFSIPVALNLHISLTFLVMVYGALVFGPVVGLSAGVVYDLLGFLIAPAAVFFPGYMLSSMLEFFLYAILLYHKRITILRLFAAKFVVNYGIHVGLGSLWSSVLYGKAYYFFFLKSLVKNTIMLPIEICMLVVVGQILLPILIHEGIIPNQKKYISLF